MSASSNFAMTKLQSAQGSNKVIQPVKKDQVGEHTCAQVVKNYGSHTGPVKYCDGHQRHHHCHCIIRAHHQICPLPDPTHVVKIIKNKYAFQ